ncbi:MAG: prepilin-type N-terminal cleavage/methylation domain-containing protein [Deltaproteobacteria bacterium]|nr:prepilin-type N-terminal cleavage/methylation domain-containing protein [Deltaproteobacteria bacterium]
MRRNQGFTITELMITVVIMGVLASIAIPSFTNYIYKARVTEATNFLGRIKQRQEAYRSEFGQYCAVDGDDWGTSWNPADIPGIDPVVWATTTKWQQLGAEPDGPIRFRYATIAGFPGVTPPADSNLDDDDHWFAARAEGDLNDDNTTFFLEIYSQSTHIYNSATAEGGWE